MLSVIYKTVRKSNFEYVEVASKKEVDYKDEHYNRVSYWKEKLNSKTTKYSGSMLKYQKE